MIAQSLLAVLAAASVIPSIADDRGGHGGGGIGPEAKALGRKDVEVLYAVISCASHARYHSKVRADLNGFGGGGGLPRDADLRVFPVARAHVRYAIVVGDETVDDPIGRLDGDLLRLRCGDLYEHLPEKVVFFAHAVRRLETFENVTHVVKADDHDSRMSPRSLHRLVGTLKAETEPTKWDYSGPWPLVNHNTPKGHKARRWHFGKVSPTNYWHDRPYEANYGAGGAGAGNWLAGGHTYVISARALDVICEAWPVADDPAALARLRTTHIFEDLMIGNALEARGIKPVLAHYGAECVKDGAWARCGAACFGQGVGC